MFTFDGSFGDDSTTEQIYSDIAYPLVEVNMEVPDTVNNYEECNYIRVPIIYSLFSIAFVQWYSYVFQTMNML